MQGLSLPWTIIPLTSVGGFPLCPAAPTVYSQFIFMKFPQTYHESAGMSTENSFLYLPVGFKGFTRTPAPMVDETVMLFTYCPLAAAGFAFINTSTSVT